MTTLHDAYRRRLARVRTVTTSLVLAAETPDPIEFTGRVVPIVLDAQRSAVRITDSYMSLATGAATDGDIEPWGIDPDEIIGVHARRGTFLEDVYGRNLRARQSSFAERMTREVNTDITLAERSTSFIHTDGDPRITGYRRVLGAGPNCGLCTAAATRRYGSSELRPIHDHCGCTTEALYTDSPVGNRKNLNELYALANGRTDARSLSAIRVDGELKARVVDTPELGPTLVAA